MIGDAIDIQAPFDVAFVFFLVSMVYARFAIPYIPTELTSKDKDASQTGISGFLAPLRVLAPQRLRMADGRVTKHYGVIFLCCGIFVGVVSSAQIVALLNRS